ncbi:MAG: PhoH family protein [Succinivibrionaceae bacterium]|nr:PhoH family protein [Succinivibrionaceae bacterium]
MTKEGDSISLELSLEPPDPERVTSLTGAADSNLRLLERRLGVRLIHSAATIVVEGSPRAAHDAERILQSLYADTAPQQGGHPRALGGNDVHLAITEQATFEDGAAADKETQGASFKLRRGLIRARTPNQRQYIKSIRAHDVSFGIGPAGTGKTFLAVAAAVDALERAAVRRIILTRPAVEAGERLGFLPGDLTQKVDPYLRPLYDALFEMLGFERVERLIERQVIEVAPLAYMRGRTLSDAFIILDEAQNTTIEQMKMFLTRIGFGSHAVITGDPSQVDLPPKARSGLRDALEVLRGVEGVSFTFLDAADVVRHPVVAAIVRAYERREQGDGEG